MSTNTDNTIPAEIREEMKQTADYSNCHSSSATSTSLCGISDIDTNDSDKLAEPSTKNDTNLSEMFSRFEAFNFDDDQQFQAGLARITGLSGANTRKEQQDHHHELPLKIKAFYYSKTVEPIDFAAYMKWRQKQKKLRESPSASPADHSHHGGGSNPDSQKAQHDTGCQLACDAESEVVETVCDTSRNQASDSQSKSSGEGTRTDGQELSSLSSGTTVTNSAFDNGVTDAVNVEQASSGLDLSGMNVNHTDKGKPTSDASSSQTDSFAVNQTSTDIYQTDASEVLADMEENKSGEKELTFAEVAELIQNGKPIPGLAQIEVVPTNMDPTPSRLPRAKKPWEE